MDQDLNKLELNKRKLPRKNSSLIKKISTPYWDIIKYPSGHYFNAANKYERIELIEKLNELSDLPPKLRRLRRKLLCLNENQRFLELSCGYKSISCDSHITYRPMGSISPQDGSGEAPPTPSNLEVKDKRQMESSEDVKQFNILFGVTQGFGILSVILVAIWTISFRGGFAGRSEPKLEFNWHPLFMTVGLIYLYGSSIMIYRALRNMRKQKLKVIHATIHSVVVLCIVIAQITVFDSHNYAIPPIPNLYTLHSWIGLIAILIFVLQWIGGIYVFLYPGGSLNLRAGVMPWHVFFGLGAFVLVLAAALSGLMEKAIYSISNYGKLPSEGMLVNFIGLCFIVFGFLVVYLVTEARFKRVPRPEDGALLQN